MKQTLPAISMIAVSVATIAVLAQQPPAPAAQDPRAAKP